MIPKSLITCIYLYLYVCVEGGLVLGSVLNGRRASSKLTLTVITKRN